ncbi:GNAT family N-acetyltransferase [Corynebacteriaceae bacterium 6-324]
MKLSKAQKPAKSLVTRPVHILAKRVIDTAIVVLTAPITLPVGVATAVAVRVNMGSPVFYKQDRVGLNEEVFSLLKFRSMLDEYDSKGNQRSVEDRIPKFGHLLRRSSLDELPQLLNVLKGDMSLVGPRPLLTRYVPHYKDSERARHSVRPGITGAAQTSGRNHLGWDARLKMDADYARDASLLDDFHILFKTVSGVSSSSNIAIPGDGADFLDEHRSYPREDGFALRRFEFRDVPSRVEWFNHPATLEYMTFGSAITEESTEKWLRQARKDPLRGDYVLCDESTDEPLAVVGYRFYDPEDLPAIYIAVSPHQQSKGHGSRVTRLLLKHMKENLNLSGAYAELYRDNGASYKLWEKLGMSEVGADLPDGRVRMEIKWTDDEGSA